MGRKIISFILAITLIFTCLPLSAFAREGHNMYIGDVEQKVEGDLVTGEQGETYVAFDLSELVKQNLNNDNKLSLMNKNLFFRNSLQTFGTPVGEPSQPADENPLAGYSAALMLLGRGFNEFKWPTEGTKVRMVVYKGADMGETIGEVVIPNNKLGLNTTPGDDYYFTFQPYVNEGGERVTNEVIKDRLAKVALDEGNPEKLSIKIMVPYSFQYSPELIFIPGSGNKCLIKLNQKVNPLWKSEWHLKDAQNKPDIFAYYKHKQVSENSFFKLPLDDTKIYTMESGLDRSKTLIYWDGTGEGNSYDYPFDNEKNFKDKTNNGSYKLITVGKDAVVDRRGNRVYTGKISKDNLIFTDENTKPNIITGFGDLDEPNDNGYEVIKNVKYLLNLYPTAAQQTNPNAKVKIPNKSGKYLEGEEIVAYRAIKRYAVYNVVKVKLNTGAGFLDAEGKNAGTKEQDIKVALTDAQINAQTIEDADFVDKTAKTVEKQIMGYSEKLKENESTREVIFPEANKLFGPDLVIDTKNRATELKGWSNKKQELKQDKSGLVVESDKFYDEKGQLTQFGKDNLLVDAKGNLTDAGKKFILKEDLTTLYAVYGLKAEGKVNVKYVDEKNGEEIISTKPDAKDYRFISDKDGVDEVTVEVNGVKTKRKLTLDEKYSAEKFGNKDETVKQELLQKTAAPTFIGYKIKEVKTTLPPQGQSLTYTEDGKYTINYIYEKLDPIIPAKTDDGSDNPKATDDVKNTYIPVTIKADAKKGKFQKSNADVKKDNDFVTEFDYYVNPVEGKKFKDVLNESGLTAKAQKENENKIDAQNPWTFTPAKVKANKQESTPSVDVTKDTEINKLHFTIENGLVAEVNFGQTTADKFKDKLDPKPIKVWKDADITWKDGVKLKEANDDLQNILNDAETKYADALTPARDSSTARKEPFEGTIKITFKDKSTIEVPKQKLYVSEHKVEEKPSTDPNYIDPQNLPDDKAKVEIKLGEGVKEAKDGGKKGNAASPVVIKTYYVKPGTGLEKADFPTTTGKNAEIVKDTNYLNNITWTPSDLTKTFNKKETGSFVASTGLAQCKEPKVLQKEFEQAANPMFAGVAQRKDAYIGKFDEKTHKVTVAIIDKDAKLTKMSGSGLIVGLTKLYKENKLTKIKISENDSIDLNAVWEYAKSVLPEADKNNEEKIKASFMGNLKVIIGGHVGNTLKNGKALDLDKDKLGLFIGKSVTLKLTVQEPDCEGNAVELTYTIEGKEAVSSILKDKLTPQDIKVWKGDTIDWEMGVKKDETGLTPDQINQIKDEFSTVEDGVKKVGKAKFEDATTPARNSDAVSAKAFVGNIKVTFSDGSELLVEKQNLYVSELMTGKDDKNAPEDAITVQFLLGNGVKANKGTETLEGPKLYETYKVKPNLDLDNYKLGTNKTIFATINPESTNTAKFKNIVWTPESHVATETNNKFTATATESFIMKHEFKLLDKDNNNAEITVLPQVLNDKLPADKPVAKGKTYTPENLAPIKEVKEGENFYDYTFVKWEPTSAKDQDKTFVGIWTREQSTSEKPTINPVKPEAKEITGKGVPGSEIEVKIPGVKDPIKTTVEQNGDWTVKVPEDKTLKTGEEIVVTQKELGKKPNSDKINVGEEPKPEPQPQPQPMPTPEYNPWWPIYFGSTKTEAKKEEPKPLERHEAYIAGYPDGTVRPDGKITRAEVSAIFARLTENSAPANYSPKFSDVLAYDWFSDSVMKLSKKDIIKGYPDGTFKPNKSITRAEFAVIASKYIKNPKAADETFSDVPMNHWAKDAIAMVKAEGWISGYTDGTFKPDAPITRAEAVSIVNRMFDRAADGEFVREHGFEIKKFNDLTDKHWAYYEIMEAVHTHDYERIGTRVERWEKIVK